MTVASQLRLAIGLVIVALAAILVAAFYVPAELNRSANEKYVRDAIPLRALVQDLVLEVVNQEAAVEGYLVTGDPERLQRYHDARNAANDDLAQIEPYLARHPRMRTLMIRATAQISDLNLLFAQQIAARGENQSETETRGSLGEIDRRFDLFRATAERMLEETSRFVDDAVADQRRTYRQLLVVLATLGTLAGAIALVLFVFAPRRLGQLYAAEQDARREAESRAEAARALEHVSDGVILTGPDGVIHFWNPAATALTGIAEHAALGRSLDRLLPGWERLARQPDAVRGVGGAAVVPIQLGHERWLSVTSVDFGEGIVYAIRDVTEERALETLRSDFVATASHELRTPLTSIGGAARTIVHHGSALPPDRERALLDMIVTESDRLSRIVDQILLASRLEAHQVEVLPEPCDAAEIVRAVVDAVRVSAPPQIELSVDADDHLPPVACDPDRLRQVLGNIVDNAIKYSPGGGRVRVELRPNNDAMRFAVHDEGLGFDATQSERVFQRFHRADPQHTRGIGGTGLGLYISRELVDRMAGRIWAESEPGRGSSFYFELPLAREAARTG